MRGAGPLSAETALGASADGTALGASADGAALREMDGANKEVAWAEMKPAPERTAPAGAAAAAPPMGAESPMRSTRISCAAASRANIAVRKKRKETASRSVLARRAVVFRPIIL